MSMFMAFLSAWGCVSLLVFLAWLSYLWHKNPTIIDVFWPLGIALGATVMAYWQPTYWAQWILVLILWLWALRLSAHLLIGRILPKHIDPRYQSIQKNWKVSEKVGFLINFQLQAILASLIALPFLFIKNTTLDSVFLGCGLAFVLVGLAGETIADHQLTTFKKTQSKKVCNIGLWQYSRHPNYFFDWLIWLGFSVCTQPAPLSVIAFISPALLYFIMVKITGPITEKCSVKSRGQLYVNYQNSTPMFFPTLKPRREK